LNTLTGINLRRALRLAIDLGCEIRQRNATGEIIVEHPLLNQRICVSARRKDCPRALSTALGSLRRALQATNPDGHARMTSESESPDSACVRHGCN